MEQFSLKTNWRLAEKLTQLTARKIHMELGRKEREAVGMGPVPLGGDTRGGGLHGLRDPPWGVCGSDYTLGAPGVQHWEDKSP